MPNPRLARRYAKSLIDLSVSRNELLPVYNDMKYLQALTKQSKDFLFLLRSPIVKPDKKEKIIHAVTNKNISSISDVFIKLLIRKGRESDLPEITQAFIDQYNLINGIHKVTLTTAIPVGDNVKKIFIDKLKREANFENVELEAKVDEKLIGGFMLEFDNNLIDASVLRDLNDVTRQFAKNVYIPNIR